MGLRRMRGRDERHDCERVSWLAREMVLEVGAWDRTSSSIQVEVVVQLDARRLEEKFEG